MIHTVGPVWEGGDHGEAEVAASCYRRSLEIADDLAARSISFPAIATGAQAQAVVPVVGIRHELSPADG